MTLTPSLTPTETFTPTDTLTPLPTATEIPPAGPLTIDYTYDALRRLKRADYSDGRYFSYDYDANGNTLKASDQLSRFGDFAVTSYQYDAANQLVTAQADATEWHYAYDANGSLTQVLPNGNETNGAKRYTYNTAGYLVRVESHDGSGWNIQAEMTYNGLGTRLTSSALGVTTQYASDGQLPLTISSNNKTISVLYGLGPVAEKMDEWNYALSDGVGVPRQLADMDGAITLSARYNPWGSPIETNGIGNFDASFIGNLLDMTTGLIYIGNGQYYDPETGRFLTRNANPQSPNPYVPWNPAGIIFGPLGLLSIYYSRKKGICYPWMALIFFLALIVLACSIFQPTGGTSATITPSVTATATPVSTGPATQPANTATQTEPPTATVTAPPPCEDCTPMPGPTQSVILVGGRGADVTSTSSAYANQRPLGPYWDWADRRSYKVIPVNDPGTKVTQRDNIISSMDQGKSYIIIGHSAGADSAILTLNDPRVQSSKISATVLLDPTLTASGVGAENDQITTLYENIAGPKVLLAGTEKGLGEPYFTKYVEPKYRYGTSSNPSIQYNPLSDWSAYPDVTEHTAMAIDPLVSNIVISWLEGLGL